MSSTNVSLVHRWLLRGIGAGATAIATTDLVRGVDRIAHLATNRDTASVDSELRFGSAWYAVGGVLMVRSSSDPAAHGPAVRLIAGGWLVAAVGRALSIRAKGRPAPLYLGLAAAEVAIAAALAAGQAAVERQQRRGGRSGR